MIAFSSDQPQAQHFRLLVSTRNWLLSILSRAKHHADPPSCPAEPARTNHGEDLDPSLWHWSSFASAVADTRAQQTLQRLRREHQSRFNEEDDDDPALNPDIPWPGNGPLVSSDNDALDSPSSVTASLHPDEMNASAKSADKWSALAAAVAVKHEAPDVLRLLQPLSQATAAKRAKMREAAALEEWKQTAAAAKAKEEAEIAEWRRQAEQAKAREAETWRRQVAAAKAEEAVKLDEWRAAVAKAKEEASR